MDIKKFKGAVFDLDGTLLDSMYVWHEVDRKFFERRNLSVTEDYIDTIMNMHLPAAAEYTKERYNLPDSTEKIVDEWCGLCVEAYANDVKLKDGALEFLRTLYENNIKFAFATASESILCETVLKKHGVYDLFSAFAYVSEINVGKTEPDIYLLAAERMGLKAQECIVFEDIAEGVKSAKRGGFTVCGVFDESSAHNEQLIREEADLYIKSFRELL